MHFDKKFIEDDFEKDNSIAYERSPKGIITIHLGFLQILHHYSIELEIPKKLFDAAEHEKSIQLVVDESAVPNINCKLKSETTETQNSNHKHHEDCVALNIEFNATREKLVREEVFLVNATTGSHVKLILIARVLGRGKGTPMLRNGIHCIGVDHDEESENSDWQSFSSNKN